MPGRERDPARRREPGEPSRAEPEAGEPRRAGTYRAEARRTEPRGSDQHAPEPRGGAHRVAPQHAAADRPGHRAARPGGPEPDGSGARGTDRSSREDRDSDDRGAPDRRLTAREAAASAASQVYELTGRPLQGVTGLERTDEGWRVGVEVLESHRIPDTTDILALYEVALDRDGDLLSYRRTRRYHRGRGDEER